MTVWTPRPLSARARLALAALSAPSTPQPLPGSVRLTSSVFFLPQPGAAALAAYRAPGAPVPAGATLREEKGLLIVDAPFGASAIFFTDAEGGCNYRIAVKPTLIVKGAGDVPDINAFARVAVAGQLLMSQTSVAGKPWIVIVNNHGDDERPRVFGTIRQMSFAQAQADKNFEGRGQWWPAATEQMPGKVVRVRLKIKAARVEIEATSTDTVASLVSWFTDMASDDEPAEKDKKKPSRKRR